MKDNDELKSRKDIGVGLDARVWLAIIAGAIALVFALGLGLKHFFETKGPAAVYEKQLELEEQE